MNKVFSFVLLSIMLISFTAAQGCNSFYGGDLVQSGKYAFVNPLSHNAFQFSFTVPVHFVIPSTGLQIATTASTIANYNPLIGSGFNFLLSANRQGSTNSVQYNLLIVDDYSWSSIQVGYLLTSRTDLAIGNYDVNFQPSHRIDQNTIKYDHSIVNNLPTNTDYQVVTYISGMGTFGHDFTLSINDKFYNKVTQTITIFLHTTLSTSQLFTMTITYVIYPSEHSIFSFVSRTRPLGNEAYHLSGPVAYNGKAITYSEWAIKDRALSCVGAACESNCVRTEQCIATFGNIWESRCVHCAAGVIFERGICTRKCGANQLYFRSACICPDSTYIRVGTDCIKEEQCGPNQSRVGGECICNTNYALWQDTCRRCPSGSAATPDRSTCDCGAAFTFDAINNVCVSKCLSSQSWSVDRCICNPGWISWNLECKQCPSNSAPNAQRTTCVCSNGNHVYFSVNNQCTTCPNIMVPNNDHTQCLCPVNTVNTDGVCVEDCPVNRVYAAGECVCKFGFLDLGGNCVERCGINQVWNGASCDCKTGYARYNGACRQCPTGTTVNSAQDWCLCTASNQIFNSATSVCQLCNANSSPDSGKRTCVCNNDYSNIGGTCVKSTNCPTGTEFDTDSLKCVCTNANLHLIGGTCQSCPANQGWNGSECVCASNFFRISGVCRTCDPRTTYNGVDCVCNLGFYGTRDLCEPCHSTCSQCSGPGAGQCNACSDISLILRNGFCTQEGPCAIGSYLQGNACRECLPFCRECTTELDCQKCSPGFELSSINFGGQTINNCEQICGDSRRFEHECDDGNLVDGDGCNSYCQIQSGFSCTGGTSIKKDTCVHFIPGTYLETKGSVNTGNKVTQSVRASYLPTCMTEYQCADCYDALEVRVVESLVPITVSVSYVPSSKYQFYVEYNFPPGVIVSSVFRASIRLNRDYSSCFQTNDFNQVIDIVIDPATLALCDPTQTLTSINDPPTAAIEGCFQG